MVIFNGYDCKVFYKVESTTYGAFDDDTVTLYEIPFVESLNLPFIAERGDLRGLSSRERKCFTVTKRNDSATLDCFYETSEANSIWGMAQSADIENNPVAATTYPKQFTLVVVIDEDRDGFADAHPGEAGNAYILIKGVFINQLTISGSSGEYTKLSFDFIIKSAELSDGADTITTPTYTDIATPVCVSYYAGTFEKDAGTGWTNVGLITLIDSWSVTINNNFTKIWGLSGDEAEACEAGNVDITGNYVKNLIDFEEFDELIDETLGDLIITPISGDTITLGDVSYDAVPFEFTSGELIKQDIPFTASTVALVD